MFRDQQIKMSTWMHNLNNKLLFKCRGAIWDASRSEDGVCHSVAQKINRVFFFNKTKWREHQRRWRAKL